MATPYEKDPVGLAVEIYCASINTEIGNAMDPPSLMKESILIVKQAQDAFK